MVKKLVLFSVFVTLHGQALAGWRLADCEIVGKVGGGFAIIGTHEITDQIQLEPSGPYETLEEAEKTLQRYFEITHCVKTSLDGGSI